jgi:hypothetical protein
MEGCGEQVWVVVDRAGKAATRYDAIRLRVGLGRVASCEPATASLFPGVGL